MKIQKYNNKNYLPPLAPSRTYLLDKLLRDFVDGQKHFLLYGKVGSGRKTLAMHFFALASHMRKQAVISINANELALMLFEPPESTAALSEIRGLCSSHKRSFLFIEDMGTLIDQLTSFETRRLIQCLDIFTENEIRLVLIGDDDSKISLTNVSGVLIKKFTLHSVSGLKDKEAENAVRDICKDTSTLPELITLAERFIPQEALPGSAIMLFKRASTISQQRGNGPIPQVDDLHQHISEVRGIPKEALQGSANERLLKLPSYLSSRILGQSHALDTVVSTIQRSLVGFRNYNKPIASFLFLGPSGVGKTELAKALSQHLYHSSRAFVRIDMSEFSEAHTVQRLIGAPPGYVGYEEGGQLTNPVDREPYSLVLLDEIEKAHPKVFDIFLQLLDDGRLTDGRGKTVDFRHTIIIATSNIGLHEIVRAAEHGRLSDTSDFLRREMLPLLVEHFRPELLNRFDALIVFQPLQIAHLMEIGRRVIAEAKTQFGDGTHELNIDEDMLKQLAHEAYQPTFGARPMKRLVEERILAPLAKKQLESLLSK